MDYLQFEDSEDGGRLLSRFDAPSWPPPEKMWLFRVVQTTDHVAAVADEHLDQAAEELYAFFGDIPLEVTPFVRVSFSKLPDDTDFTHIARGGLYVPAS